LSLYASTEIPIHIYLILSLLLSLLVTQVQ
jgi:hypothetical protein